MTARKQANDLARLLEITEAERDEAVRERDEAQAVIDAVRKVRDHLWADRQHWSNMANNSTAPPPSVAASTWLLRSRQLGEVVALLDEVDGL